MGKRGPKPMTYEMRMQRFWAKVQKTDECWIWLGGKNNRGYGYIFKQYAHRFSYELANGPIPSDMEVDHRCHQPACVNPDHLRLVTRKQNSENHDGANRNSRSGFRGVYPFNNRGTMCWAVQVTHDRKRYSGGYFPIDQLDDAAAAAAELRRSLHTHNDKDRKR